MTTNKDIFHSDDGNVAIVDKLFEKSVYILPTQNKEDVDIIAIHKAITSAFEELTSNKSSLEKEYKRLCIEIDKGKSAIHRVKARRSVGRIKRLLSLIYKGNGIKYYNNWVKPLLVEYEIVSRKTITIDLTSGKSDISKSRCSQTNVPVIQKYLLIARNYIDVELVQEEISYTQCTVCDNRYEMSWVDENVYICPACGYTKIVLLPSTNFKDTTRLNTTAKYYYVKRTNLTDAIKQYQGKQNKTIPQRVYDMIELWMERNSISKYDLTPHHLRTLFQQKKSSGFSAYYDDVILIHSQITGHHPPDISHLEDQIYARFDKLVPVFFENRPEDRTSFPNVQYVLYQILVLEEWECSIDEFSILEDPERRKWLDTTWKMFCQVLNWPYYPTL